MVQLDRPVALLDRCPNCRGFWFDRTELEAVCAARGIAAGHALGRLASGKQCQSVRACPRCEDVRLLVLAWKGIEVDQCPDCLGFFLDWKELPRLARAIEKIHAREGRRSPLDLDNLSPFDGLLEILGWMLVSSP